MKAEEITQVLSVPASLKKISKKISKNAEFSIRIEMSDKIFVSKGNIENIKKENA